MNTRSDSASATERTISELRNLADVAQHQGRQDAALQYRRDAAWLAQSTPAQIRAGDTIAGMTVRRVPGRRALFCSSIHPKAA